MGKLGEEVSEKIKCAIRAKLTELGVHIDNELPDYVMVLVANKKSQKQMDEDLSLFLGESTSNFTSWLYDVLKKLEQFTISSKGMKRKVDEKKSKNRKLSENESLTSSKKVKRFSEKSENGSDLEEKCNSSDLCEAVEGVNKTKVAVLSPTKITSYPDDEEERMIMGEDDDAINLHDNNEGGLIIPDRPDNSDSEEKSSKSISSCNGDSLSKNIEKEEAKARERIKITWDSNSFRFDPKLYAGEVASNVTSINNRERDEAYKKYETNMKSSLREDECRAKENKNSEVKSSFRNNNHKVVDARDILKKKSNLTSRVKKSDGRKNNDRRSRRRSKEKGSKENQTRFQSTVVKPVVREPEKPTVPSLVKVTPRPVRPPGMQPTCNLILKAVADAEKSIATSKINQIKVSISNDTDNDKDADDDYLEKTVVTAVVHKRSRRENISVTLLNDRVVSNDVVEKDKNVETCSPLEVAPHSQSHLPSTSDEESIEKEDQLSPPHSNGHHSLPSIEESNQTQEPRFIITLENTASDTEIEGELDISNENYESCEETVTVVRQPFDKSRLGPRLGPPPVAEELTIRSDDYRFFLNNKESSPEVEMDVNEVPSENGKSQTKCKYWPCCDAGSKCPYFHPTTLCRLFPACHFGDKCLYIHPACKFADKCLNINCPFAHNSATPVVGKGTYKTQLPLSTPNGQICIYYPNCKKPFCPYKHVKKACKYASSCTKPGCEYEHPNKATSAWNPYKWVANQ